MLGLRSLSWTSGRSSLLHSFPVHQRRVHVLYRTEGAPAVASANPMPAALPLTQLDGLALTQLGRPSGILENEPLQALTRLAAANHSCQVLEALSKTALVLRDSAVAVSRGTTSPHTATISLQALFQNGYDTLVALLQALPQCPNAYGPAAMIPETCVALFHVHNVLLQAAYASQQDFEVWTELMQAGLGLYLLKAPRNIVTYTNSQLDTVLDALAHQDLWRFQRLLWQRLLPCIPSWESMQDFCSVINGCELQAQAAATAAAAALLANRSVCGSPGSSTMASNGAEGWETPSSSLSTSYGAATGGHDAYADRWAAAGGSWPGSGGLASGSMQPEASTSSFASTSLQQHEPSFQHHQQLSHQMGHRTAPATAAAASALYDKQSELAEYTSLMSECIRAAMGAAVVRGLACASQPHVAAQQLLDVAVAFDARQRSPTAPAELRFSFVPSSDWLSRVATAGVQAGERLTAVQVVKLLQDLDTLAPKPVESHGAPNRWLNGSGQAAVERAILRHSASHAWAPQQTVSVVKALAGQCRNPPGDPFCGMIEGLLLACHEARQDVTLLCTLLQEAVEFASFNGQGENAMPRPPLTSVHLSLVRVALNRAVYLVGSSSSSSNDVGRSALAASTTGRSAAGAQTWHSREFLFERYPRLLQAARHFGYPLQAFRLEDYAAEVYEHLATAPGHELVAVGPEGLTRVLAAVASTPCCQDPQWALAFERACLTLVAVQFSVGYTHPKRWLGLLETTVSTLTSPMPTFAAAIKALMVRLCDTNRHAKYFWDFLPLVGTLERRAASGLRLQHYDTAEPAALWTPASPVGVSGATCTMRGGFTGNSSPGAGRRGPYSSARRGYAGSSPGSRGQRSVGGYISAPAPSGPQPVLPPPDLSAHFVTDEEYNQWCEDLGQRLALSMTCWSDQDRVAQLSSLGIAVN